jgi:SAM-dependent methyltransferase
VTHLVQHLRPRPASRYIHPKAITLSEGEGDHDAGLDTASESAPNYLRWIADLCRPHLGQSVLEVGAGIGSITKLYADGRRVLATDVSELCVSALEERFRDIPTVEVARADVRTLELDERFDSVLMINVLEHIEDDVGTLISVQRFLRPGGSIVIYVPALNGLYGRWDLKVGHRRRYSRWRLSEIFREADLEAVELRYVNLLAIPAWAAFSRTSVERTARGSLTFWDRTAVPMGRLLESRIRVPIGLNLLGVGRMRRMYESSRMHVSSVPIT